MTLFLIFLCTVLIFLYSLGESALVAVNRGRLRVLARTAKGLARSAAFSLVDDRRTLASLVMGISVLILTCAALTTLLAERHFPGWAETVAFGQSLFIVIFCEVLPKSIGVSHPEILVLRGWRLWSFLSAVMAPLSAVIYRIANTTLRLLGVSDNPYQVRTEDELMAILETGKEQGVIEPEELLLARRILKLDGILVRDIMVAAPDIAALSVTARPDEAVKLILETGHSRIPVYEGGLDNIVGVVYAMDLLNGMKEPSPGITLQGLAKPPYFIPETKSVGELLKEMREHRVQIAIALDEHGATAGLVTFEDIVEEIVGELRDEHDREGELFHQLDSRTFIVDARMDRRQFEELTGISLPEGEFATVGGFVFDRLGRLPTPGDKVVTPQALFIVEEIQKRRLSRLRILLRSVDQQ